MRFQYPYDGVLSVGVVEGRNEGRDEEDRRR